MSNDLTLVVLAAGLGSRYGGLKQVSPLGPDGEILIDYSIYDAYRAGFSKVLFIVKEEHQKLFHDTIGLRASKLMDVDYAIQGQDSVLPDFFSYPEERGAKPWGTAHALLCTYGKIDGPFAVINADDFYGAESYQLLADYLRSPENKDGKPTFAMAGYILKNTLSENGFVSRGVCQCSGGYLSQIVERLKIGWYDGEVKYLDSDGSPVPVSPDSTVSLNIWGFTPDIFPMLFEARDVFFRDLHDPLKDEFLLPTSVDGMIQSGLANVRVLSTNASWYGVTYKEDADKVKAVLAQMHENGVYPKLT